MRSALERIVLVMLLFAGCRKQDSNPAPKAHRFIQFTSQNSPLPDNQVNAVSVAGRSIWIGTQNGLAKFSSGHWTVFTTINSGLPSSVVLSVAAVADDCVWIGTDRGLVNYCQDKWTIYHTGNSEMKNNVVKKIAVDRQRNVVWVGTENGLLKLQGNNQEWFDDSNSGLMENLITALAVMSNGSVIAGTFDPFQFQGSCWQFNGSQWTRFRLHHIGYPSSFVNSVFAREDGWWLGLGGTSGGAVIAIKNGQAMTKYDRQTSPIIGGVLAVAENENGLWVAGGTGLYQLKDSQWKQFTTKNSQLPDDHILCMQLANGKVYVGTLQDGLVEIQP